MVVTAGAVGRAKLQSNHYHQQTNTKRDEAGRVKVTCLNPDGMQRPDSEYWYLLSGYRDELSFWTV